MSLVAGYISGLQSGILSGLSPGGVDLTGRSLGFFGGQSSQNGAGTASQSALIQNLQLPFPNVWQFDKLSSNSVDPIPWDEGIRGPVPLSPRTQIVLGDCGFQVIQGRELDHTEPNTWVLASFAVGSTSMFTHWKTPGGTYPLGGTDLAHLLVAYIHSIEDTYGCRLRVFDWNQGTSDALTHSQAIVYGTGLLNLYNLIRLPGNWPTVPWVIHQICSTSGGGTGGAADVTAVRDAIATFATNANSAQPGSVFVVDDDDALYMPGPGQVHYPTDGYVRVARRSTQKWFAARGTQQKPMADFRHFSNGLTVQLTDLTRPGAGAGDGTLATWDYDHGDGSAHSTTQNPSHTYAAPGTYQITQTVTDNNGQTDTITHSCVVIAAITWPADATALKGCPVSAADWTAVLAAAGVTSGGPSSTRDFQDASAPVVDHIGTVNLNQNNLIAGNFRQPVTGLTDGLGWTRLQVVWTAANQKLQNLTNTPAPTRRILKFALLQTPSSAPAADRDLFGIGGGTAGGVRISTLAKLKIVGAVTSSAFSSWSDGTVKMTAARWDPVGGTPTTLFTPEEKILIPAGAITNTVNEYYGTFNLSAASGMGVLLDATFVDAAANMSDDDVMRILRVLNYVTAWGSR